MLEAKLCHNKTETKNAKVAKMVEFIKTCDQYPRRFKFGHFFNSIIRPFRKRCLGGIGNFLLPGGNDKILGESFAWGLE